MKYVLHFRCEVVVNVKTMFLWTFSTPKVAKTMLVLKCVNVTHFISKGETDKSNHEGIFDAHKRQVYKTLRAITEALQHISSAFPKKCLYL